MWIPVILMLQCTCHISPSYVLYTDKGYFNAQVSVLVLTKGVVQYLFTTLFLSCFILFWVSKNVVLSIQWWIKHLISYLSFQSSRNWNIWVRGQELLTWFSACSGFLGEESEQQHWGIIEMWWRLTDCCRSLNQRRSEVGNMCLSSSSSSSSPSSSPSSGSITLPSGGWNDLLV